MHIDSFSIVSKLNCIIIISKYKICKTLILNTRLLTELVNYDIVNIQVILDNISKVRNIKKNNENIPQCYTSFDVYDL